MILQSHSPGVYLEKIIIQKDIYTTIFIAAQFTIAKTQKQPKCTSTDERIKKMWNTHTHTHTHTHNEILFNHKKQLNNAIYSNMDGHKNYHAK